MLIFCYSCNFSVLLLKVANFIVINHQKKDFDNNSQIYGNILPDIRYSGRISGSLKPDILQ